jgi:hypothetical protein
LQRIGECGKTTAAGELRNANGEWAAGDEKLGWVAAATVLGGGRSLRQVRDRGEVSRRFVKKLAMDMKPGKW